MKISVLNLNRTASAHSLRELFTPFGAVVATTLVVDRSTGRSRGIGYVEMLEQADGVQAIAALHNTHFLQQSIIVRERAEESMSPFSTHF